MARIDPYKGNTFLFEGDGIVQAGFSEVSGFDSTVEPIEYREGNDPTHVRKLPGLTTYGNITLKWGVTDSTELYDWFQQIVEGTIIRKNIAIIAVDESGNARARWEIAEAWPTKYDPPDFNATGNEVAIETLEICNEGIRRVS